MTWALDNSFARLPDQLFRRQTPAQPKAPILLKVNTGLAERLGLDATDITAEIAAGGALPPGADPLAQAYAGHQFGQFVPQLGDGRALLIGEQVAPDGARFDIVLKGSGRTPFSRGGDGLAWLGPVLREYLMSEAMAALGLPTTRALAMASTGVEVLREQALPGAVLTRVASSHLRVGTFQYFAVRDDLEALHALTEHAIARHYPQADGPAGLLRAVTQAQAELVAGWMSVGFIHGVMNTDNCAISGETIDYGPCAFMEGYAPDRVFSSIDRRGRYAYANQPQIALWNLAQLGSSLVLLMSDQDAAVEEFTAIINTFTPIYQTAWLKRFGAKIGVPDPSEDDAELINDLLVELARGEVDFTNGFAWLADPDILAAPDWRARWRERLAGTDPTALMAKANPSFVPRLHQIEDAIAAALSHDLAPFERLLRAAQTPFASRAADDPLVQPPAPSEAVTTTFCGT